MYKARHLVFEEVSIEGEEKEVLLCSERRQFAQKYAKVVRAEHHSGSHNQQSCEAREPTQCLLRS